MGYSCIHRSECEMMTAHSGRTHPARACRSKLFPIEKVRLKTKLLIWWVVISTQVKVIGITTHQIGVFSYYTYFKENVRRQSLLESSQVPKGSGSIFHTSHPFDFMTSHIGRLISYPTGEIKENPKMICASKKHTWQRYPRGPRDTHALLHVRGVLRCQDRKWKRGRMI